MFLLAICLELGHYKCWVSCANNPFDVKLLSRDFYHTASGGSFRGFFKSCTSCLYSSRFNYSLTHSTANLEVKSKAPNGVAFTVKGKSDHKAGAIAGQVCTQRLIQFHLSLAAGLIPILLYRLRPSTPTSLPVSFFHTIKSTFRKLMMNP